jgi:hypothetical protein
MNIYQKLQIARVTLQKKELKKTGWNDYSKYHYFEMSDYLPTIQDIFNDIGLCGIVTFDNEMAYLTIHEFDGEGKILITTPMSTATLKACHPVQNLGAVEKYLRRYLWETALEIVEHDAIEPTTGKEPLKVDAGKKSQKPEKESLDDYQQALKNAPDLEGLQAVWLSIPKFRHADLKALKDEMKAKLDDVPDFYGSTGGMAATDFFEEELI